MVVFLVLGLSAIPILATTEYGPTTAPIVIALVIATSGAWLSYRAAVASARKYGLVLQTITATFHLG